MITSKSNELVKHIKSLSQKKYREEYGEYLVEGKKMVCEAIDEKLNIVKLIICEDLFKEQIKFNGDIEYVDQKVCSYLSDTMSPQGIFATIKIPKQNNNLGNIIFATDDLQDPGNLGTIIRTLDSAGINTLLLSKDSVDPYNPKVIRSTMGAIFRVNILTDLNLSDKLKELKANGYKIVITHLDASISHYDLNFDEKLVIVIGNESKGVSDEINGLADVRVKIPMLGKTESLNASVAASLIAYENVRQKISK